jgi:hypothetical protein
MSAMTSTEVNDGMPQHNSRNDAEEISWESIEQDLRAMDGESVDTVIIRSVGETYMGISGGNEGRYVVGGYIEGKGSFICASGDEGSVKRVVVCNDFNEYPSVNVVTLDTALLAAREFVQSGKLLERLKWEWRRRSRDQRT